MGIFCAIITYLNNKRKIMRNIKRVINITVRLNNHHTRFDPLSLETVNDHPDLHETDCEQLTHNSRMKDLIKKHVALIKQKEQSK